MPSILKQYITGLRQLASMPPEQMAVASASPFMENMGRRVGQETASQTNAGAQRLASDYNLSSQKQDVSLAKKDSGAALGVGVANLGLQGLTAWDKVVMAAKDEEDARIESERDQMLIDEIKKHNSLLGGK
jgi:hypothetical protein